MTGGEGCDGDGVKEGRKEGTKKRKRYRVSKTTKGAGREEKTDEMKVKGCNGDGGDTKHKDTQTDTQTDRRGDSNAKRGGKGNMK
ncbi:hypothetical protein E2C01_089583 [Portunus trituberculatus]|uniref:Uncharacterized protein n=1 Tax=Portunus trituberculatus TaxID=210409 RepID=A0A5B7JIM7_PORTR|nr:hypothetical protein [Portunus trituberculatus]